METRNANGAVADGAMRSAESARGFDWRAFDAYLFDIDGTLLNSRDMVHLDAFLIAMQNVYGRTVGLEGVAVQGSTDPIILLRALEQAGVCEADGRRALPAAMARMCQEVEARAGRAASRGLRRGAETAGGVAGGRQADWSGQRQCGAHWLGEAERGGYRRILFLWLVCRSQREPDGEIFRGAPKRRGGGWASGPRCAL